MAKNKIDKCLRGEERFAVQECDATMMNRAMLPVTKKITCIRVSETKNNKLK